MIPAKIAISIARKTPSDKFKSGLSAKFIPIDSKWGLKFYEYKSTRDETYKLQKKAHRYGIAPAIANKIFFKIDGEKLYGYITEIAPAAGDRIAEAFDGEKFSDIYYSNYNSRPYEKIVENSPEYETLICQMRKIGLGTSDMHLGNVGWMIDGRLVCIDFDRC